MNVMKRAFAYTLRKIEKSIVLFFLLLLISTLVTIGFSMLDAAQKAAVHLRETIGASFSIQGKINQFRFDENGTDDTTNAAFLTGQNIRTIMEDNRIKAYNAVQTGTAYVCGLFTLSGNDNCPIWANTKTDQNNYFCTGTLTLAKGEPISDYHAMAAVISTRFASENNLTVGSAFRLSNHYERQVCLTVIGLYESDPSMEFNDDTIFLTHDAYWELTGSAAQTYSGKVYFTVNDPLALDDVIETIRQTQPLTWDNYIFSKDNESYESVSYQLSTIERLTVIVITASAVISTMIFFLILVMRIQERGHEAGIMLAIGISKSIVLIQYITEVGIVLLLSVIVSFFVCITITTGMTPYLQRLVKDMVITISPSRLIFQYLCEFVIAAAAVFIAAIPIINRTPKDILQMHTIL